MTALEADVERRVDVGDTDLHATLRAVAILPRDPTVVLERESMRRATFTPDGPATILVTWTSGSPVATVRCWGAGAQWIADRADRLLGASDDHGAFEPTTEPLRGIWRQHRGLRLTRTGTLWHDLAALVLQQRIRFTDAAAQWRSLVGGLGSEAPGPLDLRLPPDPAMMARAGYGDLHGFGIERSRAETLIRSARELPRLERRVDEPYAAADARLTAIRGIGPWTRGALAGVTWGHADAVVVGDVGIPSMVSFTLTGEPRADDERMLELLEPHRPHRYRVLQLLFPRAMILKPKFVVLDEPTSALDMTVQTQIVDLLRDLQQKYELGYLFISHDLKVVRAMAHRLIIMRQGNVVEHGLAARLFERPSTDYAKALMAAAFDMRSHAGASE
ncbi:MAG: DNA-3-methyladenine glycosylase 2 family protein [Actinomycetota bacterium]